MFRLFDEAITAVARGQYGGCEKQCGSSQLLPGDKRVPILVLLGSTQMGIRI
jgi:hypothetical protein